MSYAQLADSVDALTASNNQLKTATNTALNTLVSAKDAAVIARNEAQGFALAADGRFDSEVTAIPTASKVPRAEVSGKLHDSWLADTIARWATFSGPTGASLISGKTDIAGSFLRSLQNFMNDHRNIRDFGGTSTGNGLVDDSAAIQAMATALGYVIIPSGNFRIMSNQTISVPQFYQPGAVLSADAAVTLTITNRINSPNQWIFQGTGAVIINIVGAVGEDAKTVQAGWFGVHPSNTTITDVTARIQRGLNAFTGQTREGIFQIEGGSYHVSSTMYVPRGVHVVGRGMRRTVFDPASPDFTIFETLDAACKFSEFQFEYPYNLPAVRTSPYIHVKHTTCDIQNVWLFPSTVGIIVDGTWCTIKGLRGTYGLDPKSVGVDDTSMVWVRSSNYNITDISQFSTTFAPHHIVRVGHNLSVGTGVIDNISTSLGSNTVFYDARLGSISKGIATNLLNTPSASTQSDALVKIVAAGAFTVANMNLSSLNANTYSNALLHIEASGTAVISNVVVGNATIQGSTGYGVRLLANASSAIRDIRFSNDIDVSSRATRLEVAGNVTALTLSPSLRGSTFSSHVVESFQILDDTVKIISDFRSSLFSGVLTIGSANINAWGNFSFRAAASSNHMTPMGTIGSLMEVSAGNLTGTTGTDGKITVGIAASGQLVIENRSGVAISMTAVMCGG